MAKLKNIHAGEILLEEFLIPMEISQNRLARDIGVPPRRINDARCQLLCPVRVNYLGRFVDAGFLG